MEDKILAIMDNHHCIVSEELGNRCAKELSALIDQEVKKARIDELNELNYQIAKNSWHKENAYKMYPYILDRIAELEKDNK